MFVDLYNDSCLNGWTMGNIATTPGTRVWMLLPHPVPVHVCVPMCDRGEAAGKRVRICADAHHCGVVVVALVVLVVAVVAAAPVAVAPAGTATHLPIFLVTCVDVPGARRYGAVLLPAADGGARVSNLARGHDNGQATVPLCETGGGPGGSGSGSGSGMCVVHACARVRVCACVRVYVCVRVCMRVCVCMFEP